MNKYILKRRSSPVVEALLALRGVPCTVAVTILAEWGDLTHVDTPASSCVTWA
jgi:hypothetical protein